MKHLPVLLLAVLAVAISGCKSLQNKIIVGTSTVLGFEVAQNPASQMYQVRFGYGRAEVAVVPTNGVSVLTELRFKNVTGQGGLYQRMAVGVDAIKASTYLFAKDANGTLNPTNAEVIAIASSSIPVVNSSGTSAKVPLATAYGAASVTDRAKFDAVAQTMGYANFQTFLLTTTLSSDQVAAMASALKTAGIIQ